jgi:hypothetical protein
VRAGERIGHLVIERQLGAGGMGEVYLARDDRLERKVAIKLLPADRALDVSARARILREARAASALHHPGIVTVHDIGEHDGRAFIVMEYVEGETVHELLERRGRIPPVEAVRILAEIGEAVAAAHDAGVLHRDLKPANLVVDTRGRLKVLDFGLSKRRGRDLSSETPLPAVRRRSTEDERIDAGYAATVASDLGRAPTGTPSPSADLPLSDEAVTAYGTRMGTPGYAALELVDGGDADPRSDVFSLGVILYRMITGQLPFRQATWRDLRAALALDDFEPASRIAPDVADARVDAVFARALAGDRTRRFAGVAELIAAARDAVLPPRRARKRLVAGGVAALAAAAGVAVLATRRSAERRAVAAADAGTTVPDATPTPRADPSTRRQLTDTGGCAYSPAFVDDRTIVFDLTRDGAVDLYRIDRDGGDLVQLTDGPDWEWRAARGERPGEVVYLVGSGTAGSVGYIGARDLDGGDERTIARVQASAVVGSGDGIIYADGVDAELRRIRGDRNDVLHHLGAGTHVGSLAIDPAGVRLAYADIRTSSPALCVVELATGAHRCLPRDPPVISGRAAFSPDGNALYVDTRAAIERVDLGRGVYEPIAAGSGGVGGGVALSPSGDLLVWSACVARKAILDLAATPPRSILGPDRPRGEVRSGPGGLVGHVRYDAGSQVLVVTDADGVSRDLVVAHGAELRDLAFSADGRLLAYVREDATGGGVHVVAVAGGEPHAVTDSGDDATPIFVSDGELLFTRASDRLPRMFRVGVDGAGLRPESEIGVQILDFDRPRHRVLIHAIGSGAHLWLDPRTGRTTPIPQWTSGGPGTITQVAISPSGRWLAYLMVNPDSSISIWREPVGRPRARDKVHHFPNGVVASHLTITDDGHPLVATSAWDGELWAIEPARGTTF